MKVLLISLGCDKNLVDSEFILGLFAGAGYEITDTEEEADVIVINTCCFINDAKEESIETIIEMAGYKESGVCRCLVVCGCLAQRYHNEIIAEMPEVDIIIGTTSYEDIIGAIDEYIEGSDNDKEVKLKSIDYLPSQNLDRVFSTGVEYSYLKIAEGCDKKCTYCIIPYIRGKYRSVPMEQLIKQAEYLAECGVRELIIVAQDTTLYGVDLYGEKKLPELLSHLCEIEGIQWIRLLYAYPEDVTEELADTIVNNEKICRYIDMPIQHASDRILKHMGRRTGRSEITDRINMLRNRVPGIAIRTTLITGFPGETEEDHHILKNFIKDIRFDRLGVFKYSAEENTPAEKFEGQVPPEIMDRRYDELMSIQQDIAFEMAKDKIGKEYQAIIEGELPGEDVYVARTESDAPEIDGCVFIPRIAEYITGDIVTVKITEAKGYDLIGEII